MQYNHNKIQINEIRTTREREKGIKSNVIIIIYFHVIIKHLFYELYLSDCRCPTTDSHFTDDISNHYTIITTNVTQYQTTKRNKMNTKSNQ